MTTLVNVNVGSKDATMLSLTSVRKVRSCYVLFDHHVAERIASPQSHPEDSDRRLNVVQGAGVLGISRSQVHRLLKAYEIDGIPGFVSKKRQQPSNRRHSEDLRNAVLDLVGERYADFGPTLAREKLIERHQLTIGKETLRQWITEAVVWI